MITAIVLAAGESRRMGVQKMLLPFDDGTVVSAVVRTALASAAGRVLVVLGADRAAVRKALNGLDVDFAVNPRYADGMLSSAQAGFRALPRDAEAAVVMLGDQPAIPASVVDAVVRVWRTSGAGIVVPTYRGRRGHPPLVAAKYRDEVLALEPSVGLRGLLRAHPGDVVEVPVRTAAVLRDMDRPADYARERRRTRTAA